jgi:two-component system phosphate regulon response regulator PhoB
MSRAAANSGRVLVVEDDEGIRDMLKYNLTAAGFSVQEASDGASGLRTARTAQPDLILLDLMLPGMSGFDVIEALRRDPNTAKVAVLMLTARKDEADRIRGLSLGADDYLTKPFSPPELVLRVAAILRRVGAAPDAGDSLHAGPIQIDRSAHRVAVDGREVELTATEFKLLLTLAERRGRLQARKQLLETVWEFAPDVQTRTVDMHVQRLRAKLGSAGPLIETVRGYGYRMKAAKGSDH